MGLRKTLYRHVEASPKERRRNAPAPPSALLDENKALDRTERPWRSRTRTPPILSAAQLPTRRAQHRAAAARGPETVYDDVLAMKASGAPWGGLAPGDGDGLGDGDADLAEDPIDEQEIYGELESSVPLVAAPPLLPPLRPRCRRRRRLFPVSHVSFFRVCLTLPDFPAAQPGDLLILTAADV